MMLSGTQLSGSGLVKNQTELDLVSIWSVYYCTLSHARVHHHAALAKYGSVTESFAPAEIAQAFVEVRVYARWPCAAERRLLCHLNALRRQGIRHGSFPSDLATVVWLPFTHLFRYPVR